MDLMLTGIASFGHWMLNNIVVIIIAVLLIVGACFYFCMTFNAKINPLIKSIQQLNQKIQQLKNSNPNYQQNNTDIVQDIDNFISEQQSHEQHIHLFKNQYQHFHNSLLKDEDLLSDNQIRVNQYFRDNTTAQWINIKSVFHISSFYDNASGILTGLGLLLTFIFIAFGLSELKLNDSDTGAMQEGIRHLVGNLTGKFISSILGIATAMFYTWHHSSKYHALECEINTFCSLIDNIIPIKSSNQLLSEIKKNNTDQTNSLKEFFTSGDFSNALQKALDGSNEGKKILPVLNQINDRLAKSDIGEIFDTMREFIKSISDKMNEINQQQSSGLMESMYQLQKESNKYIDNISQKILQNSNQIQQNFIAQQNEVTLANNKHQQNMNENINFMLEQVSNKTSDMLTVFDSYIDKNDTTNKQLHTILNSLLEKHTQNINSQKENLQQSDRALSYITSTAESLKQITESIQNTSNSIVATSNVMSKINDSMQEVHNSIINKSQLVQDSYNKLQISLQNDMNLWNNTITNAQTSWQTNIADMKSNQESISMVMQSLDGVIQNYTTKTDQRTLKFIEDFSLNLTKLTDGIDNTTENMQDAVEEMTNAIKIISHKVSNL